MRELTNGGVSGDPSGLPTLGGSGTVEPVSSFVQARLGSMYLNRSGARYY